MVIGVFIKGLSALAKRVAKNKAKNLKKAKGVIKAKRKEANKAVQGRKKAAGSRETIRTKELLREQRARQTREFNARPGDVTPVGGKLVGRKARAQSSGVRDTIKTGRGQASFLDKSIARLKAIRAGVKTKSSSVSDTINTLRSKIKNKEALRRNRNAKKVNLNQDFPPSKTAKPGSSLGTTKSKSQPVGMTMDRIKNRQRALAARKGATRAENRLKNIRSKSIRGQNERLRKAEKARRLREIDK